MSELGDEFEGGRLIHGPLAPADGAGEVSARTELQDHDEEL